MKRNSSSFLSRRRPSDAASFEGRGKWNDASAARGPSRSHGIDHLSRLPGSSRKSNKPMASMSSSSRVAFANGSCGSRLGSACWHLPASIRGWNHRTTKPQVAYELNLSDKLRQGADLRKRKRETSGIKRKLKGCEFTFEFVYLSQNCPRDRSKAQFTGLRHSAALENGAHSAYAGSNLGLSQSSSGSSCAHYREVVST